MNSFRGRATHEGSPGLPLVSSRFSEGQSASVERAEVLDAGDADSNNPEAAR